MVRLATRRSYPSPSLPGQRLARQPDPRRAAARELLRRVPHGFMVALFGAVFGIAGRALGADQAPPMCLPYTFCMPPSQRS
jgi:hypothetical protein